VVPARAGVILAEVEDGFPAWGGSRASGGDPGFTWDLEIREQWFPRERG